MCPIVLGFPVCVLSFGFGVRLFVVFDFAVCCLDLAFPLLF